MAGADPVSAVHARSALLKAGTARTYEAGEIMLLEGAMDTFVLVLLNGFAKVTTTDDQGTTALVDIRAAGDAMGETAAFDNEPVRPRSRQPSGCPSGGYRRTSGWAGWPGTRPPVWPSAGAWPTAVVPRSVAAPSSRAVPSSCVCVAQYWI
ncbi:Crp/Fnr family transcriptional regulator [Streptomyces avermitilis]|uniref:Crp/Fnr family transcriptional regulator n=1 Tax=Streptomyces avermitilis TaxID=33903 RepID=UPI00380AA180